MAELSEIKRLITQLSDRELVQIFGSYLDIKKVKCCSGSADNVERWYDKKVVGLDSEGLARLEELEKIRKNGASHRVDDKMLRYMRQLKDMRMEVPDLIRNEVDPKELYARLNTFCANNDIPNEITSKLVPSLISWIDSGSIRGTIIVGDKGCGKSTALRMMLEEALRIPTEIVKIPQCSGARGLFGDNGSYQSADSGPIIKAMIKYNTLLVSFIMDEIDKTVNYSNRSSIDEECLSLCDGQQDTIVDNFTETRIPSLPYCPIFFTANNLEAINPILVDRCTVIKFPNASDSRIKAICVKYAKKKLESRVYSEIDFDYDLLLRSIDRLVESNVTSLRKHQQMIEIVLDQALNIVFTKNTIGTVKTTEKMFDEAIHVVSGIDKRKIGFV